MMITRRALLSAVPAGIAATKMAAGANAADVPRKEIGAIGEEAFIYGFPMVMNYGVMYEYFIDKASSQYKAPFNQILNEGRVFTPKDTAIVTSNSDTPYSILGLDLRAEPVVVCNPQVEKGRYFSMELFALYTTVVGYIGSRTTGNDAGCFMIAGPEWQGATPPGIKKVLRCETEFALAAFRTQLFDPADIENVKKIQAGYRAEPLSKFLNNAAPPTAPDVNWPKIDKKMAEADPFAYLNFILQFYPPTGTAAVEVPLRARFAKIGVEAGKPFSVDKL